jgi:predicted transposase YdaD
MVRKDALWKGIIDNLAIDFIAFFFPEIHAQMDNTQQIDSLDKELAAMQPQSDSKLRHADKLLRAVLKDGNETWILIHVEVQGYTDPQFTMRMFQSYYRILDKYGKPPVALAIYTDRSLSSHLSQYHSTHYQTTINYKFQTFSIISHQPAELRKSGNPFGFILEIARRALDPYDDDNAIINSKLEMIKYYLTQGLDKKKLRYLMDFIRYYLRFENQNSSTIFEDKLLEIHLNQNTMGIRESILYDMKEQGREEGLEQGLEKGREQGRKAEMQKVILRAHHKGLSLPEIAELVELPEKEIRRILIAHNQLEENN